MIWGPGGGGDGSGRLVESQPTLKKKKKKEWPQGKRDALPYQWQNEARKPWEDASFVLSTNIVIYSFCLMLIS